MTFSDIWLPRTKTAVLGFSITFASRSSRARFTLADLGLLQTQKTLGQYCCMTSAGCLLRLHSTDHCGGDRRRMVGRSESFSFRTCPSPPFRRWPTTPSASLSHLDRIPNSQATYSVRGYLYLQTKWSSIKRPSFANTSSPRSNRRAGRRSTISSTQEGTLGQVELGTSRSGTRLIHWASRIGSSESDRLLERELRVDRHLPSFLQLF